MNSMTGYGKSEQSLEGRKLCAEIKSVNNRYLDINIRLPRLLMQYEELIRNYIKRYLLRGRVDAYISYTSECADSKTVCINWSLLNAYLDAAHKISNERGLSNDISVSKLLELPEIVSSQDNEDNSAIIEELLKTALSEALSELARARENEGLRLKEDIVARLKHLDEIISQIKKLEPVVVKEYQKKLNDRLSEVVLNGIPDETRLMQEIAIFADKANITEEIVRVKSHLFQLGQLIDKPGAQGKNMDFLIQELNREFNTIASKAQCIQIIENVITAKGEIEKIREQIQNVE